MFRLFKFFVLALVFCASAGAAEGIPVIKVDAVFKPEKVQLKADVFIAHDPEAAALLGREAATKARGLAAMIAARRYLDECIAEMKGEKTPEPQVQEVKTKVESPPVQASNAANVPVSYQPPLPDDADTKNYTWTWESDHWLRRPVPGYTQETEVLYRPVSVKSGG